MTGHTEKGNQMNTKVKCVIAFAIGALLGNGNIADGHHIECKDNTGSYIGREKTSRNGGPSLPPDKPNPRPWLKMWGSNE